MARNRARCFTWGVVALGALLTGCTSGDASTASSDSTPAASTEIATLHDNVALMVRAVKQDVAVPPPVVGPVLAEPTPVVAPETAPESTPAPVPVPEPVPEPVAPVLPTEYTTQPGDGLYSLANRLTASHPELQALAGNRHFADLVWNCNAWFIPNPDDIQAGVKLSLQCPIAPDQIIPISMWRALQPAPAPEPVPAPVVPVAAQPAPEPAPAAVPAPAAPRGSFHDYAMSKVGNSEQFNCLEKLWGKESGWNPNAQNPSSTAYGIAQFLDSTWAGTGIDKTSDGYRQIDAGLIYIEKRYGSPCAAWSHSVAKNWY